MAVSDKEIDDIFSGKSGSKSKAEIDALAERLEGMLRADIRRIYKKNATPPEPVAPNKWPDDEANAITQLTTNHKTGMFTIRWIDKARVSEQVARLKGLHKNEDAVDNPLREALRQIPREELKRLAAHLAVLSRPSA